MIKNITGMEILDSRGRPTVWARCELASGIVGAASVPSGASTGRAEAHELRDGDPGRYRGLGCRKAVENINTRISQKVSGEKYESQESFDRELIALDGTTEKSNLGANAILACSLAFARARAAEEGVELYKYFGKLIGNSSFVLPRPTINLFSGGKHAGGQVPIQDVLIVPVSATTMDDCLRDIYAVYQSAVDLIATKYHARSLTADEGGLAPDFTSIEGMFEDTLTAIEKAGLKPGTDVALALDVAASHFFNGKEYGINGKLLEGPAMVGLINQWTERYPILSVEDGLAEEDWKHWSLLATTLEGKCMVLGDDLLCTNTVRVEKAIHEKAANALLLKVNQCGTLTEAAEAFLLAKSQGWKVTVSARSGETEDNWLADLATGWSGDQIKIGSITQSERLAKYNRLLELEKFERLALNKWPG